MEKQRWCCTYKASWRHIDIELSSWSKMCLQTCNYASLSRARNSAFSCKSANTWAYSSGVFSIRQSFSSTQNRWLWQRMLCLTFKMHKVAGCAKHACIKLFPLSLAEYTQKGGEGQVEVVSRGLRVKFLGMWDLLCFTVYSSILSEESNKGFKPKWNQIPQASLT